jgi:hypothetical protein
MEVNMSKRYSGRIHDPNHTLSEYDIYFNDDLITGEGVYTIEEIASIFGTKTAQGSPAVITDAAPLSPVSITAAFPVSVSNANMLIPDSLTEQTVNGVTFTPQSDGSVRCSGTATGAAGYAIAAEFECTLPFDCMLSGCPAGGSSSKYDLRAMYNQTPANYYNDYGDGKLIPSGITLYRVTILIRSGQNADGLVFKPMISPADPAVSEYVQHRQNTYDSPEEVSLYDGYNIIRSSGNSSVTIEYVNKGE